MAAKKIESEEEEQGLAESIVPDPLVYCKPEAHTLLCPVFLTP
jgi:hypothetical protein